ncbi:putative protein RETICULATA-RELATED 3, chloroplastic [Iris pallida]|uniref:Uncharacterized protein n=1 Tax=Iris pallida TaxID=29817 RepID=A0AAX6GZ13_IRIPA|nr:putative protein RETICULATA-RELATED 3, chloroplastic [Iris pallida]
MIMAASQLRFSSLSNTFKNHSPSSILSTRINPISVRITRSSSSSSTYSLTTDSGNSGFHGGGGGGDSGGNNSGWSSSDGGDGVSGGGSRSVADAFFSGWRSRVAADPEFPFKVLMEEVVGVSATAVGDMASRPNFGLSELDLVLSTLVVGSIVNFVLMYLLAPTSITSATAANSSLPSYIFQPGNFSLFARTATFFYKGLLFSAVGFVSGLVGTTLSNTLVAIKNNSKDEQVNKEKKKKGGPPTVLNAATWAVHMGLSSNLRYQTLNGVEFVMVRSMPPGLFKMAVLLLRGLNNVLGGMSFVALGKVMGSQKVSSDLD